MNVARRSSVALAVGAAAIAAICGIMAWQTWRDQATGPVESVLPAASQVRALGVREDRRECLDYILQFTGRDAVNCGDPGARPKAATVRQVIECVKAAPGRRGAFFVHTGVILDALSAQGLLARPDGETYGFSCDKPPTGGRGKAVFTIRQCPDPAIEDVEPATREMEGWARWTCR